MAFPELDLFGITMGDGDDSSSVPNLTPDADDVVVLAQPAANPSTPATNTPTVIVDDESQ